MTEYQKQLFLSTGPLFYRKNNSWDYRAEKDFLILFSLLESYSIYRQDIIDNWYLVKTPFLALSEVGVWVKAGYCSDGASGPTVDDKTNMLAAMGLHDPLYQLIRLGVIDIKHRESIDCILRDCADTRVDMVYKNPFVRAFMHARYSVWKWSVWNFAKGAATSGDESDIPPLEAP